MGNFLRPKNLLTISAITIFLALTYQMAVSNLPIFHTGVELFSIIVAFCITIIAISTHRYSGNSFILFLGIGYGFVGLMDTLHTMAFLGLGLPEAEVTNVSTQLWISARLLEALTLLFAPFYVSRPVKIHLTAGFYAVISVIMVASIIYWDVFPMAFHPETGLTTFKVASGIVISLIFAISLVMLLQKKHHFSTAIFPLLCFGYISTILTELLLTSFTDVHDPIFIISHYLKLLSFCLIYKAVVETNLSHPYQELATVNRNLQMHMLQREEAEKQQSHYLLEMSSISKLDSIETMANGLAHDLKNLLMIVQGNTNMAEVNTLNPDVIRYLGQVKEASKEASELTNRLLSFSKETKPIRAPLVIDTLVKESVDLALSGSNVLAKYSFPPSPSVVEADSSQIKQVISNIIINAVQAMPKGGTLEVNLTLEDVQGSVPLPLAPGEYAKISFIDQGTGIEPEILDKIFEPFFTTKAHGHGLGLSTSYSIIKKHNGHLTVASKPGGTTFTIFFPTSQDRKVQNISSAKDLVIPGSGKILVMDDDTLLLSTLCSMLEYLGYDVHSATEGQEALALYQENHPQNPFTGAILDLTIPGGMGGEETAFRILRFDPKAKLIVTSGYRNNPAMSNCKDFGFKATLLKPYSLSTLSQTLHKVLAEEQTEVAASKDK